jgi:hypothetical protein
MKFIELKDYYNPNKTIYLNVDSITFLAEESTSDGETISRIELINGKNVRVLENNLDIIQKIGQ